MKVGDQVEVIGPHTYNGSTYTKECAVGDILVITYDEGDLWLTCSRDRRRYHWGATSLRIDRERVRPYAEDEELDKEARRLFGVEPSKHCPTCTCHE